MPLEFDRSLLGREFDRVTVGPITREQILDYIEASGETYAGPTRGEGDLVAPPTFVAGMRGKALNLRKLTALGLGMDAGKNIEFGAPVRPGDVLTAHSTIHDVYEKTGRSGNLAFVVLRTVMTNQRGQEVAVIDQRMMVRQAHDPTQLPGD